MGAEIGILLVTLVLGTILSGWFAVFMKRPKLEIGGSGSGGGAGPHRYQAFLSVTNPPGLVGIKLKQNGHSRAAHTQSNREGPDRRSQRRKWVRGQHLR